MEIMIVEKLPIILNNNVDQPKINQLETLEDLLTYHTLNSNKTIKNFSRHTIKKHKNYNKLNTNSIITEHKIKNLNKNSIN